MESFRIKSLLFLMSLCAVTFPSLAAPISWQQAQLKAQAFLQQRGKTVAAPLLRQASVASTTAYYVFNVGNDDGYVIIAGDDCVPAILGYADEGSVDVDHMPCNMRWWLDEYARQIQFVQRQGVSASRTSVKSLALPAIPPLLTTRWNQTDPFNMYCPLDTNGKRCVTGCVATAMAQVLNYHRHNSVIQTTHEIPAYVTQRGVSVAAVPAGSFIDWENMADSYNTPSATTDEQKAAVANLMKYCGAAVQMKYKTSQSGAMVSNVAPAMVAYFNYTSHAQYLKRDSCGLNDEEWENLVYSELSNSRPVFYGGCSETNVGHAFVCDGYDGEGYFHLNWGWGDSGGYYRLSATDSIDNSNLFFVKMHEAVFFAEPRQTLPSTDGDIRFTDPFSRALCLQAGDENDDGMLTTAEALAVEHLGPFAGSCMFSFDEFQHFTGVTAIGKGMFRSCEYMKSITLPNSITTIEENAFLNCYSLEDITIPSSVTSVGNQMFGGCNSLKRLTWNVKSCMPTVQPIVPAAVERLTLGDSVVAVPNNFAKNSYIKYLTFGKSVNKIGTYAFYKCTGLTNVSLPDALNTIGNWAFYNCTRLQNVTFGNSLTSIGERAFADCTNLQKVAIPNSVTTIGTGAFRGCTRLESVTIGKSINRLNQMAFVDCDSLKTVTCLRPDPLTINVSVFKDLYDNATLRVPMAAVEAYQAAYPWSEFSSIVGIDPADGDVNLDGMTDIDDVTALIDQLLKGTCSDYSDVDGNGVVDIDDLTILIDKLLGAR